jgi:hypothetical protein
VTKKNLGIFYNDIKTNAWSSVMYNFYFMSRRFMTVMVLVWMEDLPFFQMQFLLIFSTINFIYLVVTKPVEKSFNNKIEIFNEACILLCAHEINVLLDDSIPTNLKDTLGWVIMATAALNILVNLSIVIVNSIVDIFKN